MAFESLKSNSFILPISQSSESTHLLDQFLVCVFQELTLPQGSAPAICLAEANESYGSRESAASPRNNVVCLEFTSKKLPRKWPPRHNSGRDQSPTVTVQGCSQNSGLDKAAAGRVGDANQRQPYLSYQGPPLLASKRS